jgi:type I restriction enzyme R subunit
MQAFSRFINDESLNDRQIPFVKKVIHHIEQNRYMEKVGELLKLPFDKPMSSVKMFDQKTQEAFPHTTIRAVKPLF